jgi:sulfatase modifying factor 1
VGGSVRRWRAALTASILAIVTALVAGSCYNPLNWALQAWGHLDMVTVQGGTLTLGNVEGYVGGYTDELPTHYVAVSTFLMSRYEVTQQLYYAVTGTNPSYFKYDNGFTDDPCRPVDNVTWQDAARFCNALSLYAGFTPVYTIDATTVTWDSSADGYRLPTEAEWEYAARGGQDSMGFYLAGSDNASEVAWFPDNSVWDSGTSSYITNCVGARGSNELGLYDMSGNVCEWVWDGYSDAAYYQYLADYWNVSGFVPQDPPGPNMYSAPINQGIHYVARGGSTNSDWDLLRSAMRFGWDNDVTDYIDFGFRVVRNQ